MPDGSFTAATPSNTPAIMTAILAVAQATPGLTIAAAKGWAMPEAVEIASAGFPFLAVLSPTLAGSESGRGFNSGISRQSGAYFPAWNFELYLIFPQGDVTNPLTYTAPEQAKNALVAQFVQQYSLQQTCDQVDITDAGLVTLEFVTGQRFVAAKLVLRALEQLIINNTPA